MHHQHHNTRSGQVYIHPSTMQRRRRHHHSQKYTKPTILIKEEGIPPRSKNDRKGTTLCFSFLTSLNQSCTNGMLTPRYSKGRGRKTIRTPSMKKRKTECSSCLATRRERASSCHERVVTGHGKTENGGSSRRLPQYLSCCIPTEKERKREDSLLFLS